MGVVRQHQPVMPDRPGVVFGLHHRPQHLSVEHRLIGLPLRVLEDLPQPGGGDVPFDPFRVKAGRQQHFPERLQLFGVRLFVHPVDKRQPQPPAEGSGRFVGQQHKLLDHPFRGPPLPDGNAGAFPVRADRQLTFGRLDLRHAPFRPGLFPQGVEGLEGGQLRQHLPVFFGKRRRPLARQQPVDLGVDPLGPRADDRFDKPEAGQSPVVVQLHQRRKGKPVLAGI